MSNNKLNIVKFNDDERVYVKRKFNIMVDDTEYFIVMTNGNITSIYVRESYIDESGIMREWDRVGTVSTQLLFGIKRADFIEMLDNLDTAEYGEVI